jgi:hypothetical protein
VNKKNQKNFLNSLPLAWDCGGHKSLIETSFVPISFFSKDRPVQARPAQPDDLKRPAALAA